MTTIALPVLCTGELKNDIETSGPSGLSILYLFYRSVKIKTRLCRVNSLISYALYTILYLTFL